MGSTTTGRVGEEDEEVAGAVGAALEGVRRPTIEPTIATAPRNAPRDRLDAGRRLEAGSNAAGIGTAMGSEGVRSGGVAAQRLMLPRGRWLRFGFLGAVRHCR